MALTLLLTLVLFWLAANVISELLEEATIFLEPVFAVLQWAVLRRYFRRINSWVVASLAGWLMVIVVFFLGGFAEALNDWLSNGGLLEGWPTLIRVGAAAIATQELVFKTLRQCFEWTIIGCCQWFVWRQAHRQAFWWILASGSAGALRGITGTLCNEVLGGMWDVFLAPLTYGLVTGLALLLFLQVLYRPPMAKLGYR